MSSSPTCRKFIPEPLEATPTSSHRRHAADLKEPAPSHEPLSSRSLDPSPSDKPSSPTPRRFLPQPVEETTRSFRKFQPEPVETTSRSRRKKDPEEERQHDTPEPAEPSSHPADAKPRKFAPEPVESTKRSRRGHADEENDDSTLRSERKLVPEAVETTTVRRRREKQPPEEEPGDAVPAPPVSGIEPLQGARARRFSPELLETARGSYKRHAPGSQSRRSTPEAIPADRPVPPPSDGTDSKFSAANLAKRHHQKGPHSYATPDLPVVESDSSEESDVPSLSATLSASSDDTIGQLSKFNHLGHDSPHICRLPSAEHEKDEAKFLREQAMAAYVNEKEHEPVAHYAIGHDEDEAVTLPPGKLSGRDGIDARTFRRDSAVDLDWHMSEMRAHHSQLEALKKHLKETTVGASRFSAAALASRKARGNKKRATAGRQKGHGLAEMINAASPPMLGGSIVFPRSVSPKHTRLTPDQMPVPRSGVKKEEEEEPAGSPKLWLANTAVRSNSPGGLWMGTCLAPSETGSWSPNTPPSPRRSGIITPAAGDGEDPVKHLTAGKAHGRFGHGLGYLPLNPPNNARDEFATSLEEKLRFEKEIDREFHEGVVTQVYNYLSLGYPSLAHRFDEELSKISRIPVEELRNDDERTDAKGYVGAPEGEGMGEDAAIEGKCARWSALRLYIREWARQQPRMVEREREDWGVRGRRGSWAI